MRNIRPIIAAFALVLMIMPVAASAQGDQNKGEGNDRGNFKASFNALFRDKDKNDDNDRFRVRDLDKILDEKNNFKVKAGIVTTIGVNTFSLLGKDGVTYTVNTSGSTFSLPFKGTFSLAQLQINDSARVKGTLSGTTITAKSVLVVPANKQAVKASGTITAVSGNTATLQTKGDNAVTVNTSGATVTKADGTVGTTSDVAVGTNVKIKGLWDSVTSVFNAIKIGIQAMI